MAWIPFLRFLAAFVAFYVVFPTFARGRSPWASASGWVSAFVRFSLFLEASILLLGMVRLALPGTLAALCAVWLVLEFLQRNALLVQSPDQRRAWLSRLLDSCKLPGADWISLNRPAWNRRWKLALLPCVILGMTLLAKGLDPVQNWRMNDADSYDRALSLAVLSSGHDWRLDTSVPLLLPLHYLASTPAPRTMAFSGPLFAALLVAGTAWAAYSLTRRALPAIAAMSLAALVASFQDLSSSNGPVVAMGGSYLLLALALWRNNRVEALMAIAVGITVSPTLALLHSFAAYCVCVGAGVSIAGLGWGRDVTAKFVTAGALAGIVVFGHRAAGPLDGSFQYEESADFANRLVKDLPRNSWALVSRAQELPFVYGRGWHVNVAQFVADADFEAARDPAYRVPVPVRDVYFFVETKPLQGYAPRASAYSDVRMRLLPAHEPMRPEALARASNAFDLAEWLTAYRMGHDDLTTVFEGENLVVLRAPGNLQDED